ncbi:MAG TPA: zinc ribbon domain-containing protein [Polyangiaceae bacterium]
MNPPDLQKLLNRPQDLVSAWIALTVIAAVVVGVSVGLSLALLVLAGGALFAVIGLLWWSLHSLTGSGVLTLEDALSMAAPSTEEEQKRAVLRALKDLELEKSLGKISDDDYRNLSSSYRQQAKALIRALDTNLGPLRAEIDVLVAERMKARADGGAPRKKQAKRKARPVVEEKPDDVESAAHAEAPFSHADEAADAQLAPDEAEAAPESTAAVPGQRCPACQLQNDIDARFCKRCGVALEATS